MKTSIQSVLHFTRTFGDRIYEFKCILATSFIFFFSDKNDHWIYVASGLPYFNNIIFLALKRQQFENDVFWLTYKVRSRKGSDEWSHGNDMLRASEMSKWWKVPQETLICLPRQLSLHTHKRKRTGNWNYKQGSSVIPYSCHVAGARCTFSHM